MSFSHVGLDGGVSLRWRLQMLSVIRLVPILRIVPLPCEAFGREFKWNKCRKRLEMTILGSLCMRLVLTLMWLILQQLEIFCVCFWQLNNVTSNLMASSSGYSYIFDKSNHFAVKARKENIVNCRCAGSAKSRIWISNRDFRPVNWGF